MGRIRELDRSIASAWHRSWSEPRCRWMVFGWIGSAVARFVGDVTGSRATCIVVGSLIVLILALVAMKGGEDDGGEGEGE